MLISIVVVVGLLGIQEEVGHLLGLRLSVLLASQSLRRRLSGWGSL